MFVTHYRPDHEKEYSDLAHFINFINYYSPPLKPTELYMVCDALRTSRSNIDEKINVTRRVARFPHYDFTAMEFDEVVRKLHTMEYNIQSIPGYQEGQSLESYQNIAAAYIRINPADMKSVAVNMAGDIINALANPNEAEYFLHLRSRMKSQVFKNKGTRTFSDIDIDFTHADGSKVGAGVALDVVQRAVESLRDDNNVVRENFPVGLVYSGGGVHAIIPNKGLSHFKCGPNDIAGKLESYISMLSDVNVKEAKHNESGLLPMPSTLKYGRTLVRFKEV